MKRRSGFTLVELVVVLGVVSSVLALLIPALRAGVEAARRNQCLNNLKQYALAFQSYHATYSVYPPGVVDEIRPFSAIDATRRMGWAAMLLPMIEQSSLYHAINFDRGALDVENGTVHRAHISSFLCPDGTALPSRGAVTGWFRSTTAAESMEFGRSSYAACHHDREKAIDVDDHGVCSLNSRVRAADVSDGLSQTIFLGELADSAVEGWFTGGRATLRNTGTPINGVDEKALGVVVTADAGEGAVPTAEAMETLSATDRLALPPHYVGGFGSHHLGDGAIFAFGDGSARFIRRTIDPTVYQRLGNREDGEEVDGDAY